MKTLAARLARARSLARASRLARNEVGGSTIETALIFSLAATCAVVMREAISMPLLQKFMDAAKTLENVLG